MLQEDRDIAGAESRPRIVSARSASGVEYFYVDGEVRVREGQLAWAEEALRAYGIGYGPTTAPQGGYHTVELVDADVPTAVRVLRTNGISAQPHYAATLAYHVQWGPYSPPEPIDKIHPLWDERVSLARKLKDADGSGAIVVAIDTGVVPFDSSLEIHQGKALGTCDEDPDTIPDSSGVLLHYAAHGTFVVGRIIAENPHAKVSVFRPRDLQRDNKGRLYLSDQGLAKALARSLRVMADGVDLGDIGDGNEPGAARDAARILRKHPNRIPAVLNLSLSAYAHGEPDDVDSPNDHDDDDDNDNPLPLSHQILKVWHRLGVSIVSAAGNEGDTLKRFPAAYSDVIGVGAEDRDGVRAPWSNHGPWVNVYRMGVDAVSAYLDSDGTVTVPRNEPPIPTPNPRTSEGPWDGYAIWNGTSFAAPTQSGRISNAHN